MSERTMDDLAQPYSGEAFRPLYTGRATVTAGQAGHARLSGQAASDDGALLVGLSMPKALGGPGGAGTNPEQLLAAGWAACFHGALALVGRQIGVDASTIGVSASVTIGRDPADGGYALSAQLAVLAPGLRAAQTEPLVRQAHAVCPYSKAMRGAIPIALVVEDDDGARPL
jgi:lipoyl-dependent peroxiredoxin